MQQPVQTFATPGLQDDFYLNLLDWSSGGLLAAGIQSEIVIWRPERGSQTNLNADPKPIPSGALRLKLSGDEVGSGGLDIASMSWSSSVSEIDNLGRRVRMLGQT